MSKFGECQPTHPVSASEPATDIAIEQTQSLEESKPHQNQRVGGKDQEQARHQVKRAFRIMVIGDTK